MQLNHSKHFKETRILGAYSQFQDKQASQGQEK